MALFTLRGVCGLVHTICVANPNPHNPPPPSPNPGRIAKESAYGGFDGLTPSDAASLSFETRKYKLLKEIIDNDPDLLSVQEIDHFYDFFQPALKVYGYESFFQPKQDSPCLDFGYFSDGVAVFWKTDKFELYDEYSSAKVSDATLLDTRLCSTRDAARHATLLDTRSKSADPHLLSSCVLSPHS